MSELKPWLDDRSDADDFERSILRAGLRIDPEPGRSDEVWTAVLSAIAIAPAASVVATAAQAASVKAPLGLASKAAAVGLSVGKGFVVGLALYGAASGASQIADHLSQPALSARATALAASAVPSPRRFAASPASIRVAPESSLAPAPPPSPRGDLVPPSQKGLPQPASPQPIAATALPSVVRFPEPLVARRSSQLQAEAAALRSARADLRAGKLTQAFATLEASRLQFVAPELHQEREALMIELLFRSGQVATARRRAGEFLKRFPESPHAAALRELQ